MNNKIVFIIFFLPFVLASCGNDNAAIGGSGLIEATEITISSQVAGKAELLRFDEGDKVAPGDTLAVIDTTNIVLLLKQADAAYSAARSKKNMAVIAIQQAEHNFALAEKEFNRAQALIKTGSVNQQQYDQAENAFTQADLNRKQARAALAAAEADLNRIEAETALLQKQLNDCFPTAPRGGTITAKYMEAGELVTLGKAIYKIAVLDSVWVKVYLPPADLTKITLGGEASIDPEDGRAALLPGTVTWISSKAEFTPKNVQTKEARADLVYAVKITIPNPGGELKVGMPVSVTIP
jgi:HlyD family secretion protein